MKNIFPVVSIIITAFLLTACASKAERQFVNGCKSSGIEGSTCTCIYKKLEKKYGEDEFKNNLYTISQSESFQRDMIQSTMQCMKE